MLRQSGAPLGMYKAVMGWHLDVLKRQQIGKLELTTKKVEKALQYGT
jgi:hypothetical protein